MDLRKKCDAAEKRKKRSKRGIEEVVKEQTAAASRMKNSREEQARKETPSEREHRLEIEASKKRWLRHKEKQSKGVITTAKKRSVTKSGRTGKLPDLSVDLVRPLLAAYKYDIGRTLIKKSTAAGAAGPALLQTFTQSTPKKEEDLKITKKWAKRELTDKQKKILATFFFSHRKPAAGEMEDERKPAAVGGGGPPKRKKEEQPNTKEWTEMKLTDKQKEMLATLLFDLFFRLSAATANLKKK